MPRWFSARIWLVAAAALAACPASAQTTGAAIEPQAATPAAGTDPLATARAAEARLDFAAALEALSAAIAARPDDPAPRLARAALHRKMNRPALALEDLATALERDPANREARLAKGALFLELSALSRAVAEFDALLAETPDDVAALIGRAQARTRLGLTALALADYDAALALAPDTPGLAEARARLASPAPAGLSYDPGRLMDPAFQVKEGTPDAPAELVIVHAGDTLAEEAARLPREAYLPALDAGVLSVTHLFTYTGRDGAIWANLALICAGPQAFGQLWTALTTPEAAEAIAGIDAGRGRADFDALVSRAYAEAGLTPTLAADCAFSRGKAVSFLANWTEMRDAGALRGPSIYEAAPVFVLDGTVLGAEELAQALVALAPADAGAAAPSGDSPAAAVPPPAAAAVDDPAEASDNGRAAAVAAATAEATPAPDAAASPDTGAPAEEAPVPASFGPVDATARIPAELRGIWAPSLVACLAYEEATRAPATLDAALPRLNPLDGGPIGTVLLTSRRMVLFNAVDTTCDLLRLEAAEDAPLAAQLACRNRVVREVIVPMTLTRTEGDGPAPRLAVRYGAQASLELVQCRALGALGLAFAPLWQVDAQACRASAPVMGAVFTFAADSGALTLTVTPDTAPAGIDPGTIGLALDGANLAAGGGWAGSGWRLPLGDFAAAAERLAQGLLLEARVSGTESQAIWSRLLPLLGSGQTMAALEGCAAD